MFPNCAGVFWLPSHLSHLVLCVCVKKYVLFNQFPLLNNYSIKLYILYSLYRVHTMGKKIAGPTDRKNSEPTNVSKGRFPLCKFSASCEVFGSQNFKHCRSETVLFY